MKINFDTIQKDLASPFKSTINSSFNIHQKQPNQSIHSIPHSHNFTHSLIINPTSHHNKFTYFPKPNHITHNSSVSNPNLFSSDEKKLKTPKKFNNLKTIQDMQSFINQMNRNDSSNQLHQKPKHNKTLGIHQLNSNQSQSIISQKSKQLCEKNKKIEQVTSRLYQTFKDNNEISNFCKRKSCKQMISTIERRSTEDQLNFTGQPNIDRMIKSRDSFSKLYQSLDVSIDELTCEGSRQQISIHDQTKVHERLFKDAEVRRDFKQKEEMKFEQKCIELSKSLQNKGRTSASTQKNLSTSRGFYQRLSELTARHKNRPKLCQLVSSNSYLLNTQIYRRHKKQVQEKPMAELQKKVFQKAAMLSKDLTKCTRSKCHQTEELLKSQQFIHAQQKPQISDKTRQIMQHNERELLKRIKGLFYERKTKKVKVNSAKIYTLSEKEFGILFELIKKVQKRSGKQMSEKKLDEMITKFYHNLGFCDKQQLRRSHMASISQVKNRRIEKDMDNKQKLKGKKFSKNMQQGDKNLTDCSSFDTEVDYCARLAMYV